LILEGEDITPPQVFIASTCSKLIATSITYPHEVIRTRIQTQTSPPYKYHGILSTIRVIYREEGFGGFYCGLTTNLLRVIPASAIILVTYEILLKYIDRLTY
jgi:solute carrier family 25 folate transporter 32